MLMVNARIHKMLVRKEVFSVPTSFFLTKHVGIQKNCLSETVLLMTHLLWERIRKQNYMLQNVCFY